MSRKNTVRHAGERARDTDGEARSDAIQAAADSVPTNVDLGCLALLLLMVAAAWCLATGKGISTRWDMPTTYGDPVYADFLGNCGTVRALEGWSAVPYGPKASPNLGAPEGVNWNATPTPDEALHTLFRLLTRSFGLFAGFNLGVLLGHLTAALTFYLVARRWTHANPTWSFVASLAFGLAPYLFAESPHHINCQYVWHLPLFPIVWTWVATESGLQWRSSRFWQAGAIAFITGLQNPYYTFIFCQLVLLGAIVPAWRQRRREPLWSALGVVACAACGFLIGNIDTISYRMLHESVDAPMVGQQAYRWLEIYGFKIVDLFIPWITHHSATFAKFGLAHRQASVLNDEEGCAYLGLLGIACLLFFVGVTARAILAGKAAEVPTSAWWLLWIVLFFNVGGINSLIATFSGFMIFRTAIRYSIVVLVVVLLHAAQRASAWQREAASHHPPELLRVGTMTAAAATCVLILWDQVPRAPTAEQTARITTLVESDRAFVSNLEERLPDNAMIFQLPVMDLSPAAGVSPSHHFRPYLYSTHLRWTHGALPGTKALLWQQAVQQRLVDGAVVDQQARQIRFKIDNVRRAVDEMRAKHFSAIYINRNWTLNIDGNLVCDRGRGLCDALLELGYDQSPIYSPAGDLVCIPLGVATPDDDRRSR